MRNTMEYKGYYGSVEFSEEDKIFLGKVLGIQSLISYEGNNAIDLVQDFHDAVDDYLSRCKEEGRPPEIAYIREFQMNDAPKPVHRSTMKRLSDTEGKMNELAIRLNEVKDSYYGFVAAVLTYVKKKETRFSTVTHYLDENPDALSSEILQFIANQDDFFEDTVYAKEHSKKTIPEVD